MRLIVRLGFLAGVLFLGASCDQGSKPTTSPATTPEAASTSSERKQTHPQQPTGQPQAGEGKQIPANR
jgi:hypothetical protein